MPDNTIRDYMSKIENREVVLPEFQREFTWNKTQTRTLVDSLLKHYPIGSILLWRTKDVPALKNMPDFSPEHRVEVLLDGQQRLTALYFIIKNSIVNARRNPFGGQITRAEIKNRSSARQRDCGKT